MIGACVSRFPFWMSCGLPSSMGSRRTNRMVRAAARRRPCSPTRGGCTPARWPGRDPDIRQQGEQQAVTQMVAGVEDRLNLFGRKDFRARRRFAHRDRNHQRQAVH
jgi:hypothetical protein